MHNHACIYVLLYLIYIVHACMQKPDSISFTMNNQPMASPEETTCNTSGKACNIKLIWFISSSQINVL